jgi:hypothetical protein
VPYPVRAPTSPPGLWLQAGIFFTFAPFGAFIALVQQTTPGWFFATLICALAGTLALGWAEMFRRRGPWFLLAIPLIVGPIFLPDWAFGWLGRNGWLDPGSGLPLVARQFIIIVGAVLMLSVGFTCTVQYIRRQEALVARSRAELDLAASIHASLVPPFTLALPGLAAVGRSRPSTEMGGDLIDTLQSGDRVDILLADVSGHGIKAGVIMGVLKGALRTRLAAPGHLGDLATTVNAVLADLTEPAMFATFAALRLGDGPPHAILAGHLPILHRKAADPTWRPIDNRHLPLAIDPAERFEPIPLTLNQGDELALFTDGLTETHNPAGQELGLDRFTSLLEQTRSPNLQAWHSALFQAVDAWGPPIDDQSLILIRIT